MLKHSTSEGGGMAEAVGHISAEQKRAALDPVLCSQAMSRNEQLRGLLAYPGQQEMNGQRETLTEYQIAVEGLGLPAGYAPGEDSTVRNRANTLRRKVNEIYRTELAGAQVRIEFITGSYLPRFVFAAPESLVTSIIPPRGAGTEARDGAMVGVWLGAGGGWIIFLELDGDAGNGRGPGAARGLGTVVEPGGERPDLRNCDPADAGAGDQGPRYVEAAGERAGAGSTAERGGLVCEAATRSGGQQDLSVAFDERGGFGGCAGSGGRGTVADERGGIVSGAGGTVASDSEAVVHWLSKAPFRLQLNAATGDLRYCEAEDRGPGIFGQAGRGEHADGDLRNGNSGTERRERGEAADDCGGGGV